MYRLVLQVLEEDPNLPIRQGEKGDVEFFSARTGEVLHRLWNYTNKGIVSLTEFNSNGTSLMIAQGYQVRVVGVKYPKSVRFPRESEFKAMMKSSRKDDSSDSDGDDPPQEKRKRNVTKKKPPAGKSRGAGRGKKKA
ncbi:unnamed protein product [Notodromas monacha]|uniref:Uncharacterized protein n=1 Tax=Notodromas monacha TaxID=399045 RepID=A0A7R9BQT1_9CRUS|nr:unnamed protein product [Notodromas monacha]CAG0919995.1 unnamed protein product [Notodromas monacha]